MFAPRYEFFVSPASEELLPRLAAIFALKLPELSIEIDAISAVHAHSRSVLSIMRQEELIGCIAFLMLNEKGLRRLLTGRLNTTAPPLFALVPFMERAAAVYVWGFVATHGFGGAATSNIMRWLDENGHGGADIYSRPVTAAGNAAMTRFGGAPVSEGSGLWVRRYARG